MPDRRVREGMVVQRARLGTEPVDDLMSSTTAEVRLEIVELLSRRMWELVGAKPVAYNRADIPVLVTRRE